MSAVCFVVDPFLSRHTYRRGCHPFFVGLEDHLSNRYWPILVHWTQTIDFIDNHTQEYIDIKTFMHNYLWCSIDPELPFKKNEGGIYDFTFFHFRLDGQKPISKVYVLLKLLERSTFHRMSILRGFTVHPFNHTPY